MFWQTPQHLEHLQTLGELRKDSSKFLSQIFDGGAKKNTLIDMKCDVLVHMKFGQLTNKKHGKYLKFVHTIVSNLTNLQQLKEFFMHSRRLSWLTFFGRMQTPSTLQCLWLYL